MTYPNTDQLAEHFAAWLDQPAQAALKAEGGDALEMAASNAATPEQVRWLEAFCVIWDDAETKEGQR